MGSILEEYDLVIIGGGPSGMSCAISASNNGVKNILLIEREEELGGELNETVHCNYGKDVLGYEVSGSEYAQVFVEQIKKLNIDVKLNTNALGIEKNNIIYYVNPEEGMKAVKGKAIALATGSRELFNCNVDIPFNKIAGIYTIGAAQRFINAQGYLPGKRIIILGSGDKEILIARRLIVEGAKIMAIIEPSNHLNCKSDKSISIINDFNIPVKLNYNIIDVVGEERVSGVVIEKINKKLESMECDSLLISLNRNSYTDLAKNLKLDINKENDTIVVNKLFETNIEGIYACGNSIHCDELSDVCARDGKFAGENISKYLNEKFSYENI